MASLFLSRKALLLLVFLTISCAPKNYSGIGKHQIYAAQVAQGLIAIQNVTDVAISEGSISKESGKTILVATINAAEIGKAFSKAIKDGNTERAGFINSIKALLESAINSIDSDKRTIFSLALFTINVALDQLK